MNKKKKVIVVGGGFAGIQMALKLDKKLFDVLLIDKLNHHQFQPLFYQVATSQIEPSSISFPLRHVMKKQKNVLIRMANLTHVYPQEKRISTTIGDFEYDYLVIAMGCKTNFFGNENIGNNSFTLKTTYDAIKIRNHILQTFERIASVRPDDDIDELLNLVIVGGGPTGVELAGAFAEIKRNILPRDYPRLDFTKLNIYLIEGTKNTLNTMSKKAQKASKKYLEKMGVQLVTETFVTDYDGKSLNLNNGNNIKTNTVIWAAGVTPNQVNGLPGEVFTRGKRITVDRFNLVDSFDGLFAVGDIAYMETPKYPKGHPQVANVAINQARNLAKNLKRMERGKKLKEYEYQDLGSMATIGRNKAVVDLPFIRFKGHIAWFTWMFLHLMLILSVRNKLIIFINWAFAYFTKDTALRLILTDPNEKKKQQQAKELEEATL